MYAIVQVHPNEFPILETEDQEIKFKAKFANDIKLKLAGYKTDIRFVFKAGK